MNTHAHTSTELCSIASSVVSTARTQEPRRRESQASLRRPVGTLTLVSANDPSIAVHAGWNMAQVLEELAVEATEALERGQRRGRSHFILSRPSSLEGDPLHCLLAEIARQGATAVIVGSHGISRVTGIALGAVSTYLLHEAPCSVFIARGSVDAKHWPQADRRRCRRLCRLG